MEESIKKFMIYLSNENEKINNELSKEYKKIIKKKLKENKYYDISKIAIKDSDNPEYIIEIANYKNLCKLIYDQCDYILNFSNTNHEIFLSFNELSFVLNKSNLPIKDQLNVIMFFIKTNIKNDFIDSSEKMLEYDKIYNLDLKYTSVSEIINLVRSDELNKFLKKKSIFNKNLKNKQNEIKYIIDTYSTNATCEREAHKTIQDLYINNNNYSSEDINYIIDALKKLNVDNNLLNNISCFLNNKFVKKQNNDLQIKKQHEMNFSVNKFITYINDLQNDDCNYIANDINNHFFKNKKYDFILNEYKKWTKEYLVGNNKETYFDAKEIKKEIKKFNQKVDQKQYIEMDVKKEIEQVKFDLIKNTKCDVYIYFNNDYSSLEVDNKINNIEVRNKLINILNKDNVTKNVSEIDNPIELLCNFLEDSSLKAKDKIYVIMYFLNTICNANFSNSIRNIDIKQITKVVDILNDDYFNNEKIDEKNIDNIVNALESISIPQTIINQIKIYLNTLLETKTKEEKKITMNYFYDDIKKSEEEKKSIREELSTYFDFENMKLIRFLNREETNKVIILLKKLKVDDETIIKFIKLNEKELEKQSLLTKYNYLIDKVLYYKDIYCLDTEYNDLLEFYNGIINNEEKETNEEFLQETIKNVLKLIPNTYDYELKEIK